MTPEQKERNRLSQKAYQAANREAINARAKIWKAENKDKVRASNNAYNKANPEKYKNSQLKLLYGLTLQDYLDLIEKQNNKCAICKSDLDMGKNTQVDHCHTTNKVRGILCNNCNLGLGRFKDNKEYLKNAIDYLEDKS